MHLIQQNKIKLRVKKKDAPPIILVKTLIPLYQIQNPKFWEIIFLSRASFKTWIKVMNTQAFLRARGYTVG